MGADRHGPSETPHTARVPWRLFATAAAAHVVLAISASALPEWGDIAVFRHWADRVAASGIGTAYSTHPTPDLRYDWPPLYLYLSKLVGFAYQTSGLRERLGPASPVFTLLLKLPMVAINLTIAWLLFRMAGRLGGAERTRSWAAAAWLWNPAIALATDVFGYQDALHTGFLIAAADRLVAGSVLSAPVWLTLAALTKPQAWIFLLPFVVFLWLRTPARDLLRGAGFAALAVLLALSPFVAAGEVLALARAHVEMPSLHPWPSALAHNLWWLFFPVLDERSFPSDRTPFLLGLSPLLLGLVLVAAYASVIVARLVRRPEADSLIGLSALLAFGFFMLATQIHENHMYAMFPFLTLAAARSGFLRGVLVGTTVTFAVNLYLALYWLAAGPELAAVTLLPSIANALANLAIFAVWTRHALGRSEP
jgi:Gpi18-like mannosyltransferase